MSRLARQGLPRLVRSASSNNSLLIRLAEWGLVLALGVMLARLFWIGLGPITPPPAAPAPRIAATAPSDLASIDPFRMAAAPAAAAVFVETGADLAETTLNLKLHGTWVDEKGGMAIIGVSDNRQSRFSVGDAITSGVTLTAVFRDHVVISRSGVREALRLVNRDPLVRATQAAPATTPSAANEAASAEGFASIGSVVVARPQADAVGGLRLVLEPADDVEAFEELGLRPGDALVAIDNQPVSADIAGGLEMLAAIEGKPSVTISVERDGVVLPITLSIPQGVPSE